MIGGNVSEEVGDLQELVSRHEFRRSVRIAAVVFWTCTATVGLIGNLCAIIAICG